MAGAGLNVLALLMREIRLRKGACDPEGFFSVACQLNLPWLFVVSELLVRKYDRQLVFLGRDCQLLSEIYGAYYAGCVYRPFSRIAALRSPDLAIAYLRSGTDENALLVDISSTGATWQRLPPIEVEAIIYSDQNIYTAVHPTPPASFSHLFRNSECGATNAVLEILNCADHGHLEEIGFVADQLFLMNFAHHEMGKLSVEELHSPARQAVKFSPNYRKLIRQELTCLTDKSLRNLFCVLIAEIFLQTKIEDLCPTKPRNESEYLRVLADMESAFRP